MTETLSRSHTSAATSGPRRLGSRLEYSMAYPHCQAYPPSAHCSSESAVPGCDYVSPSSYWFTDEIGQAWLITFSRHRADVSLPRGQGHGNIVACNVGMIGPPVHWGGTGEVLVLAENIAMDAADDRMAEHPRPGTLSEVRARLQ